MEQEALEHIERIIGYEFSNREVLIRAFTHSSDVGNRLLSNERLEFLGDSVLALVICRTIFERFEGYLEGDLTKIKSMLVSRRTCAKVASELGVQNYIKVGKGMFNSRSLSGSIAAGLLEAIIAAIYLDGGFENASRFILRVFDSFIDKADAKQTHGNFKSLLQQHSQQRFNATPIYELLDEKGPDHDKCFEVEIVISDRHFQSAWGKNKKDAEQKAAFNALVELGVLKGSLSDNGR